MAFIREIDTQTDPEKAKAFRARAEQAGKERKFMNGTSRHAVQMKTESTKTRRLENGRWVVED